MLPERRRVVQGIIRRRNLWRKSRGAGPESDEFLRGTTNVERRQSQPSAISRTAVAVKEIAQRLTREVQGTERTRQKLFVPGVGVLVNSSTPLTVIVLVSCPTQLIDGTRSKLRSSA